MAPRWTSQCWTFVSDGDKRHSSKQTGGEEPSVDSRGSVCSLPKQAVIYNLAFSERCVSLWSADLTVSFFLGRKHSAWMRVNEATDGNIFVPLVGTDAHAAVGGAVARALQEHPNRIELCALKLLLCGCLEKTIVFFFEINNILFYLISIIFFSA